MRSAWQNNCPMLLCIIGHLTYGAFSEKWGLSHIKRSGKIKKLYSVGQ